MACLLADHKGYNDAQWFFFLEVRLFAGNLSHVWGESKDLPLLHKPSKPSSLALLFMNRLVS